jgi:PAS domain S-box-containing protein
MTPLLRILLIDDNPHDRALVIRELRREFPDLQVDQVTDAKGFDRALQTGEFDLVITDYQLHWSDGLFVLQAVKPRYPGCPVIMFTGTGSEEVAVQAMKAGLDDYVLKSPKHFVRLTAAVRSALERTEVRERATRLERRLETLLNQLRVGVFRATPDGKVVEANPAFWHLLGLDAQEPRSTDLNAFYHPPGERARLVDLLRESGRDQGREVQLRRADGGLLYVSLTRTLSAAPGGETFIDGLMEDITERKQAEKALQEMERVRVLAETAGAAAHEINQPLTVLMALTEIMLMQAAPDDPQRQNIEALRKASERISGIVRNMEGVRHYATKPYAGGIDIVDFEASAKKP